MECKDAPGRTRSSQRAMTPPVAGTEQALQELLSFRDNSESMKAAEVAVLVLQHGWTFDAAVELTHADPERARRRLRSSSKLPFVPTPAMIQAECRRLRHRQFELHTRAAKDEQVAPQQVALMLTKQSRLIQDVPVGEDGSPSRPHPL